MERRVYFILGDLLSCIVAGAAGGWLILLVMPGDWFVLLGMVIGMALGMVAGMLVGALFSPLFGAMELMLPASLSGMLGGMVVGMMHAMAGIGPADAAWSGAAVGILCLAFTYRLQARLHGEVE
ncbi:MAG: hypothetical protein IIC08_05645 [Proteobacteria bacterium]|nr:hypothetical protein [Pseudomonadota bacterium]